MTPLTYFCAAYFYSLESIYVLNLQLIVLAIDAHTKFEVSSFSCSRDIEFRIIKIWAVSAMLLIGPLLIHLSVVHTY